MESIAGIKIYLLIERFWTALKKNKKMKDASTKKVTETFFIASLLFEL